MLANIKIVHQTKHNIYDAYKFIKKKDCPYDIDQINKEIIKIMIF